MQDKDVFRNIFVDHWASFKKKHPTYDTYKQMAKNYQLIKYNFHTPTLFFFKGSYGFSVFFANY